MEILPEDLQGLRHLHLNCVSCILGFHLKSLKQYLSNFVNAFNKVIVRVQFIYTVKKKLVNISD